MRTIVCDWEELPEELLDEPGYLELPESAEALRQSPSEGEMAVATLKVSQRVTAVPGRLAKRRGRWFLKVETRDWDRLGLFAQKLRSPPSSRSPGLVESVRDIRIPSMFPPVVTRTDAMFLRVVLRMRPSDVRDALARGLGASGVVLEILEPAATRDLRTIQWGDLALVHLHSVEQDLEIVRAIRQREANLPVICLGALPSASIVAVFSAGADDYVPDSVRAAELAAKLMTVVRRKKAREKNVNGPA